MRKIAVTLTVVLVLASCAAPKAAVGKKPLYEILTSQPNGGANIRFYEIVSEKKEMNMLLGDKNLKKKIKPDDINTSNFIILSMGEKTSGGYSITVDSVVETSDKIVVTVKETEPKAGEMTASVITYPYAIVKINSKKAIEIN
jgi:hypothetical protein